MLNDFTSGILLCMSDIKQSENAGKFFIRHRSLPQFMFIDRFGDTQWGADAKLATVFNTRPEAEKALGRCESDHAAGYEVYVI